MVGGTDQKLAGNVVVSAGPDQPLCKAVWRPCTVFVSIQP